MHRFLTLTPLLAAAAFAASLPTSKPEASGMRGQELPGGRAGDLGNAADPSNPAPPPDPGPNLFVALQEQIGLKLSSDKGPVGVLIIDHVEKPTAN